MKPRLTPDLGLLSLDYTPTPTEVKLRIGLGLVILVGVTVVISLWGEDGMLVFMMIPLGFLGLFHLFYGIRQSRFEKHILFEDSVVSVTIRGWLGKDEWRERIADFEGVVLREAHLRQQSVGNIDRTKTHFIVELRHSDPAKTLPLYVSDEGSPPGDIQVGFAKRFHLPALTPDQDETGSCEAEGMGEALAARSPTPPPGKPPKGIEVREDSASVRIVVKPAKTLARFAWLFYLLAPLTFAWIVFNIEADMALPVGGATLAFVLMIRGLAWLVNRRQDDSLLRISIERGVLHLWQPGVDMPGFVTDLVDKVIPSRPARPDTSNDLKDRIALEDIEQIRIDRYTSHAGGSASVHGRLLIEGGGRRLQFLAPTFEGKRLPWLRDYLAHLVTSRQSLSQ